MSGTSLEATAGARTRVTRSDPDAPPAERWEMWQRTPPPGLQGLIAGLWAGDADQAVARHQMLPNGELMLMFHLGPTQRLTELGGRACDELLGTGFLAGLQERPSTFETFRANTRVVAARLWPAGAWRLLGGLPQAELTGRVVEIEAALGTCEGVRVLHERMAEAPDLGAALDLLEAWLVRRVAHARAPHSATDAAGSLLRDARGALRVDGLADAAEVSPRRLRELFAREVGVPPKRLARILRFREALERLATAPAVDLTRLALECGYYDQAHLYRDFRSLAAMTPLDYLTRRHPGSDTPDVLGS